MTSIVTWSIAVAGGLMTAATWHACSKARERRKRLARGEIRPLKSEWTTVGGLRIHAYASTLAAERSTTPVVLIHGFGVSSAYFLSTGERLAREFDVYAPDLPGHGRSDTPPTALDIPLLADALTDWMDAMEMAKAAFVANSMGCQIVVDLAVRRPECVERLVLIAPSIDPHARTVVKHIRRFVSDILYERPPLSWIVMKDFLRMNWRAVQELRYMMSDRIEDKLPRVTAPTMLVRGERDPIVPQRWFDEAASLVRAEQVAVIPGWGHAVNYSAPDEVTAAIVPFLGDSKD
jgi:pimeloyl-ACP methyl ester carboxylesterase